jgi:hypothetical protein
MNVMGVKGVVKVIQWKPFLTRGAPLLSGCCQRNHHPLPVPVTGPFVCLEAGDFASRAVQMKYAKGQSLNIGINGPCKSDGIIPPWAILKYLLIASQPNLFVVAYVSLGVYQVEKHEPLLVVIFILQLFPPYLNFHSISLAFDGEHMQLLKISELNWLLCLPIDIGQDLVGIPPTGGGISLVEIPTPGTRENKLISLTFELGSVYDFQ